MARPRKWREELGLPKTWRSEGLELLAEALMNGGGPDVGAEARSAFVAWIVEVDRELGADLGAPVPMSAPWLH